jgi:glucan-binding YG repeat protein
MDNNLREQLHQKAFESMFFAKGDSGFTFLLENGEKPQSGFSVSLGGANEMEKHNPTAIELNQMITKILETVKSNHSNFNKYENDEKVVMALGGWINPENQNYFIEITRIVNSHEKAIELCGTTQISYYCFDDGKVYPNPNYVKPIK